MPVEISVRRDETEYTVERDCDDCGSPVEFSLVVDGGEWGSPAWHVRTVVSHFSLSLGTWSEGLTLHGPLRAGGANWVALWAKMQHCLVQAQARTGCWRG